MPQPWEVDATGEVIQRDLSHPVVAAGEWDAVEDYLGLRLPWDYKDLVGDGSSLLFADELVIRSPFDEPRRNLFAHVAVTSWAEAMTRAPAPEEHPGAVYPEPGGILGWGVDGGGGEYHWDTSDPDPDNWTIVVTGRPVLPYECHLVGLVDYLAGLADGTIAAAALGNWPGPRPEMRRLERRD